MGQLLARDQDLRLEKDQFTVLVDEHLHCHSVVPSLHLLPEPQESLIKLSFFLLLIFYCGISFLLFCGEFLYISEFNSNQNILVLRPFPPPLNLGSSPRNTPLSSPQQISTPAIRELCPTSPSYRIKLTVYSARRLPISFNSRLFFPTFQFFCRSHFSKGNEYVLFAEVMLLRHQLT